ncbi:MAG: PepSY-associated TM helix domain-containing protein [Egibacteraceae bacterium]
MHRWLGILLGVWVLLQAATGFIIVFHDQVNAWLHPSWFAATPGDLGPQAALDAAEAAHPNWNECGLTTPATNGGVYSVCMEDAALEDYGIYEDYHVYVDPGTATVNGVGSERHGFVSTVYRLHSNLLLEEGAFGVGGVAIVGWLGLIWLVVLLAGSAAGLTQRVRRWWYLVRVHRGQSTFRFTFDLHRTLGLVLFIPLAAIVLTGFTVTFPDQAAWVWEKLTPANGESVFFPPEDVVAKSKDRGAEPLDADEVTRVLEQRYPDDTIAYLDTPKPGQQRAPVFAYLSLSTSYDPWNTQRGYAGNMLVLLDQYTGRELWSGDPSEFSAWTQFYDLWAFQIHAGGFGRTPTRLLWLVIAAGVCVSAFTGYRMWILRRRTAKQRRQADLSRP